jgi:hypothetical protein
MTIHEYLRDQYLLLVGRSGGGTTSTATNPALPSEPQQDSRGNDPGADPEALTAVAESRGSGMPKDENKSDLKSPVHSSIVKNDREVAVERTSTGIGEKESGQTTFRSENEVTGDDS